MKMKEKVVKMRERRRVMRMTDLFEDIPVRLGENLNVEREAAQSESSFNSNTVRPAPDVDENVETNRYARAIINSKDQQLLSNSSRFKLWKPVILRETWNFIAICIHMGLDKKPTLHDY
ncbi:PiggyBac transposase uribo2 [Plakobranchus ocellatus]|uniref:PiggyBac transposase uribo2 n=1 Tax=Plakobranchus ocellatus TaxID=259542 RepID=A0AAV3ZI50_9GAST|nr:PiggyBac transposase uribo2 [Plakobranchus ocellatus]